MMYYIKNIVIEDARIIFRNFSGKSSQYNPAGNRSFALVLTQDEADQFAKDGWNVKYLKPREPGDESTPYINVNVKYFKDAPERNPHIYLVAGRKKTLMNEDTVGTLDYAEITNVDLVVAPYRWSMQGRKGVAAYIKTMYVSIEEDFGGKYDFGDDNYEPFNLSE